MKGLELVYKHEWIVERIYYESDKLINFISNTERFEERASKDVAQYLLTGEGKHEDKRHITYLIKRKVWEARNKFHAEESTHFANVIPTESEEEETEYEPEDVLANVESAVMVKEMAALLAQDDRRKSVVEAWMDGNTNNASISRTLARTFGGTADVHRVFIHRFRNECHALLDAVI